VSDDLDAAVEVADDHDPVPVADALVVEDQPVLGAVAADVAVAGSDPAGASAVERSSCSWVSFSWWLYCVEGGGHGQLPDEVSCGGVVVEVRV
jgi:hypothetical protein